METQNLHLPPAEFPEVSFEAVLQSRRSGRLHSDRPLSASGLATLLWAGYGHQPSGGRTPASAGGIYPMSLTVVAANVSGIPAGIYRWDPETNALREVADGDRRREVQDTALSQASLGTAAAVLAIAGDPSPIEERYGPRAPRYALQESGHAAQNVLLAAAALGLAAVPMGAFEDDRLAAVLRLPPEEQVYYLIPVGYPG